MAPSDLKLFIKTMSRGISRYLGANELIGEDTDAIKGCAPGYKRNYRFKAARE